ncbi:autotransporter outer membrane beta-barrel domain-containing protein [Cetobacterium sp. SF1]|uniref:autotransporter outer membrane beta-barrel domain-containing protein n=1 Tax=unclassified Cetobacterium TaxID=2630983 RepID=UPI003CF9E5BA
MKKMLLLIGILLAMKSYGESQGVLFFTQLNWGRFKEKNVNHISYEIKNKYKKIFHKNSETVVIPKHIYPNPTVKPKPSGDEPGTISNPIIWVEGNGVEGKKYINKENKTVKSCRKYCGIYGIKDAKIINNGWVNCKGVNTIGIRSDGETVAINRGVITTKDLYDRGMLAFNDGKSINDGNIYLRGECSFGMGAFNSGVLENNKNIYCIGPYTVGMNLEKDSKMVNNGYIIVSGTGASGADLNTTTVGVNRGEIRVKNGAGVRIFGNSEFLNEKNMICDENGYGTGVSLIKDGLFINKGNMTINNGEATRINGNSKAINEGTIDITEGCVANFRDGGTFINNKIINLKNKEMVQLANGPGKFLNRGKILGNGEVSKDTKFYLGKTGEIKGTVFNGDIHMDKDVYENNYSDEIKLKNNLLVDKYKGKILVDNPMYEYKLSKSTKGYDISLKRKSFLVLMRKAEIGKYLENNYRNGFSERNYLFNNLKGVKNKEILNSEVEDLLGEKIYPTMGKVTKDIVDFNRDTLFDQVYSQDTDRDVRWIGGYSYKDLRSKTTDTLYGHRERLHSVYLGGDRRIGEKVRVGAIITVGNLKSDYSNDSTRKDSILQGDLFLTYNPWKSIKYMGSLSYGGTSGSVDRVMNVNKIHKKYHSHLNNRYFSFSNRIEKTFNFGSYYIIPGIEGDYTRINQGSINEKGNYGLSLKKVQYNFIQGGPRITLGKTFPLGKYYKLNCEVTGKYTHEFLQGYRKTQSKMTSFSPDSYNISKYNGRKNTGLGVLKLTLIRGGFSIYGAYNCGGDMGNLGTVGLVYKF